MQCQPFPKNSHLPWWERLQGGPEPSSKWAQQTTNQPPFPRNGNRFETETLGHHDPNDFQQGRQLSILVVLNQSNRRCWFSLGKRGKHLWFSDFSGLVRELLSPSLPSRWLNTLVFFGGVPPPKKLLFQDAVDLGILNSFFNTVHSNAFLTISIYIYM